MNHPKPAFEGTETIILIQDIRYEHDIVLVRQRARQIADLLGFHNQDQIRIATATSEIARNAFTYAGGGKVEFLVVAHKQPPPTFLIRVRDEGPGIANLTDIIDGTYTSKTGMGMGIVGARRLLDHFHIESTPEQGTSVSMGKPIPVKKKAFSGAMLREITEALMYLEPQSTFEEIRRQNQELIRIMDEQAELNRELADTNRGVLALHAELEDRAIELKKSNEIKSKFASYLSHEMRTPVSSILTLSKILLDETDGDLNQEQGKQVGFIHESAGSLLDIVNDMLDLSKLEAGKTIISPNQFEIDRLFSSLRGIMGPLNKKAAVDLIFEPVIDIPAMVTDESKVTQILRNLISNALKFTERGEIRVSALLNAEKDAVEFSVADTGIGISPEDQASIFDDFVQANSPIQKTVHGTGLGLALSKRLAKILGGTMTLESKPGVGSTFRVLIPLVLANDSHPIYRPLQLQDVDRNKDTVLVVEDDPEDIAVYEELLQANEFQVVAVQTVKDARQALDNIRPLAVILDMLLPDEDGWTLLVEMKQQKSTQDIPVIVASMMDYGKNQGMLVEADDYCVKPINRQWLLTKLEAIKGVKKVLIIDDDEIVRYSFRTMLKNTQYQVLEAAGGNEGLQIIHNEKPQMIFLDLVMPQMSGFEVLEILKGDSATQDIPVCIHSSKKLSAQERQQLLANAEAILSKGAYTREQVVSKIKQLLVRNVE